MEFIKLFLQFFETAACFCLAFIVVIHDSSAYVTAIEYVAVALAREVLHLNITLPGLHVSKLIASLLFFLCEVLFFRFPSKVYDYYFPQGGRVTLEERSNQLSPRLHRLDTEEVKSRVMFTSCVGFSVQNSDAEIMKRLRNCGKRHDWASTAVYSLSCHKYLSYCCVLLFRWLTWIAVIIVLLLAFYAYPFLMSFVTETAKRDFSEVSSNVDAKLQSLLPPIFALIHFLLIVFDIRNFSFESLRSTAVITCHVLNWRGFTYDAIKFILTMAIGYAWATYINSEFHAYYDLLTLRFVLLLAELLIL
jgi:hypothetical protein